ncbi:MAG TPA: fasciclin domain-containing protein [Rhizomicrobium sp.]|nr:fasciclin domain-containing protein [Rhizomicrobium sp.]
MQHMAIAAAATALVLGGGSAAVTINNPSAPAPVEASNPMVAGAAMLPGESILDNVESSPEHNTMVAEIKAAGLASTLKGEGEYTIFAPTDTAYAALGKDRVSAMLTPAQAAKDARYLVVAGRWDSQKLLKAINEAGGQAKLKTLAGGTITAMLNGPTNIVLVDEKGNVADISIYDIYQKNGVIQVIDKVVLPA